ncbi:peptidase family M48-domain-containing protein [Scleroderma citrinum]
MLPYPPPSRRLQTVTRYLSTTPRRDVQYTRFSNQQQHHGQLPRGSATRIVIFVGIAGSIYYVAHLEQVPETGRWRFMDISPRFESKLAQAEYAGLLTQFRGKVLPADHPITRHVRRVVTDILYANNLGTLHSSEPHQQSSVGGGFWGDDPYGAARPQTTNASPESGGKEWNLLVVNDPSIVNAMATFGNIVVFTGILPICKDEQGLAAVLGHEIGHVGVHLSRFLYIFVFIAARCNLMIRMSTVARHPQERYSSSKIFIFVATLLQSVGVDWGLTNIINTLLLDLPNSRKQELEVSTPSFLMALKADTIGMRLVAQACYDPRSALEMHLRLAEYERTHGGSSIEFLRTHPGPIRRIRHLEEVVPEADAIRASNPRCAVEQGLMNQFTSTSLWGNKVIDNGVFRW